MQEDTDSARTEDKRTGRIKGITKREEGREEENKRQ
jgi:hypothetical protein